MGQWSAAVSQVSAAAVLYTHFTGRQQQLGDVVICSSEVNTIGVSEEFVVIPTSPKGNNLPDSPSSPAFVYRDFFGSGRASRMARRRQAGSERTRETPSGFDVAGNGQYLKHEYLSDVDVSLSEGSARKVRRKINWQCRTRLQGALNRRRIRGNGCWLPTTAFQQQQTEKG